MPVDARRMPFGPTQPVSADEAKPGQILISPRVLMAVKETRWRPPTKAEVREIVRCKRPTHPRAGGSSLGVTIRPPAAPPKHRVKCLRVVTDQQEKREATSRGTAMSDHQEQLRSFSTDPAILAYWSMSASIRKRQKCCVAAK
jgi:hypothetical protein